VELLKKNFKLTILVSIVILVLSIIIIGYIVLKKEEKKEVVKKEKKENVEGNSDEVILGEPDYPDPLNDMIFKKIGSHNKEWLEKINVLNNKNIDIIGYKDEDICDGVIYDNDTIAVNMRIKGYDFKNNTREKILKNIVEKDTDFIKDNLRYFDKTQKRKVFHYFHACNLPKADNYGYKNYIAQSGEDLDLNFTRDSALNVYFTNNALEIEYNADISDNVEVLEFFEISDKNFHTCDKVKHKIKSLKYIILYIYEHDYELVSQNRKLDRYKEKIKKVYPDVEVFIVIPKKQDSDLFISKD